MTANVETVGIDLAGAAKRTAVCRVRWLPGAVEVEFIEERDDHHLVELIDRCAAAGSLIGVDCPLGWPVLFAETLAAHQAQRSLPPLPAEPTARVLNPLLYRLTDEVTWQRTGSRPPLSVAANLLGVVALRCAKILDWAEREHGLPVDRTGRSGVLAEVYPAATLRLWQLSGRTSYKRPDARGARQAIVDLLEKQLGIALPAAARARCEASHDELDALIAAFTARAVSLRRTHLPETDAAVRLAEVEGWIHLPDCAPAELLA